MQLNQPIICYATGIIAISSTLRRSGMDTVQDLFGKKIKAIRRARDITQEKLADLSGLSLQYIGEIERGRRNPSLTSIEQLSQALDIPMVSTSMEY